MVISQPRNTMIQDDRHDVRDDIRRLDAQHATDAVSLAEHIAWGTKQRQEIDQRQTAMEIQQAVLTSELGSIIWLLRTVVVGMIGLVIEVVLRRAQLSTKEAG
jgi:hypothetical protein